MQRAWTPTLNWLWAALVTLALVLLPSLADAAEVRESDRIEVRAGEVVDDALIALGEVVVIRGEVRGDVVALARSVTVEGLVEGNLITAARRVSIDGEVKGSVMTLAQTVNVRGLLGSQLYASGQTINLSEGVALAGDAMLAGAEIAVDGTIGRDVYAMGDEVRVKAELARDLVLTGSDLSVGSATLVGRDLIARVADEDDLFLDKGAAVLGSTSLEVGPFEEPSRYESIGYYVWKVLMIAAGMLVGIAAYVLVPDLFRPPRGGKQWLRICGIGLLALIAIPVASAITAATVIGLPLAVVTMGGYMLALYIGKLVIAAEIGRRILRLEIASRSELVRSLLLGLVLVTIAVSLPWVGAVVAFIIFVLGLGAVCNYLIRKWNERKQRREPTASEPAGAEQRPGGAV